MLKINGLSIISHVFRKAKEANISIDLDLNSKHYGYKDFKSADWFFKVHWPGDPNMPGMLQVEALVQMSSLAILTLPNNKGKIMYLVSSDKIKFIKKIIPNSRFNLESKIKYFKRGIASCEGSGFVNNELVCKAEFNLILPEEIKQYNLKR